MFSLGRDKIELIKSFKGSASMMVTISRVVNKGKTEDFFRIKLYSYLKYFAEYYAINSHALQLS